MADHDGNTRPEVGRIKKHLDSNESDNERPSRQRRPPPFLNDGGDDNENVIVNDTNGQVQHDRSSSSSAPAATASATPATPAIVRPPPAAFPVPTGNPTTTTSESTSDSSSSGPPTSFRVHHHHNNNKDKKTKAKTPPIHSSSTSDVTVAAAVSVSESADGRRGELCVDEGYMHKCDASASASASALANGPDKSVFSGAGSRARSGSESGAGASNHYTTDDDDDDDDAAAAAAVAADVAAQQGHVRHEASALHLLAEAAQLPEACFHIRTTVTATATASPQSIPTTPTPTPTPTCDPDPAPAPAPQAAPTSVPTSKKCSRNLLKPSPLFALASPPHPGVWPAFYPPLLESDDDGNTSGKGKRWAILARAFPERPEAPRNGGNGEGASEERYEHDLSLLFHRQLSIVRPGARLIEPESAMQDHPRKVQNKKKNKAASSKKVGLLPQAPPAPPAPAEHLSYHHAGGDCIPSHSEAGPSGASNDIVCEGGQSLSSPQAIVNHYPIFARNTTTSKESSLAPAMADSRSVTPGPNTRVITLLIEDRRHGTDHLTEVHVPLTAGNDGCFWADAKDVCFALQSGPSRIDGPAKVFTMRGKYRQKFLLVSADGEELTQSANLKVETDGTLPVIVEGISDSHAVVPAPFLNSNPNPLVSPRPGAPGMNTAVLSSDFGLDEIPTTLPELGQRSGGARKRKRETGPSEEQRSPFGSPAARSMPALHEQYSDHPRKSRRNNPISSDGGGCMSDSSPAADRQQRVQQGREQTHSGSFSDRSGYEMGQPSSVVHARPKPSSSGCSSDHKMSSLLQPPPTPMGGPQRMHDKVISFLRDKFMEDTQDWNAFSRDHAHVGSLSNVALLRIYWFAQKRLDTWVGSRLPKHLNYKKVEIGHVFDALGVTNDWYWECYETLSLVNAYGERGKRWESPRAVAACRDRAPPELRHPSPSHGTGSSGGPTDLLMVLREVHEEYCERTSGRNGQGRGE